MTEEAVLHRVWDATTSGGSSTGGRVVGGRPSSKTGGSPRGNWLRRLFQAAVSPARNEVQATLARGLHWMGEGAIGRGHLPNGGWIGCQTGRIWVTADGGGEDVILCRGEFRWFQPGARLLIEAIATSEILVEA